MLCRQRRSNQPAACIKTRPLSLSQVTTTGSQQRRQLSALGSGMCRGGDPMHHLNVVTGGLASTAIGILLKTL
jgi:hypothetical protein